MATGHSSSPGRRPWSGLVPDGDLAALEARGNRLDRPATFGSRPALIVVDMTRSFVDPGFPASCSETGGDEATIATRQVLGAARGAGIPVFFTKILQTTPGSFLPIELGRGLPGRPDHLAALLATPPGLPDGNEIADQLTPVHGEVVIPKPKPSAFFGTALEAFLTFERVDNIIVTGMVTSGCVRATVIDGYMRNLRVNVVEEAVADYSSFQHRWSLLDMHAKYAHVTRLDDVLAFLGSGRDTVPSRSAA